MDNIKITVIIPTRERPDTLLYTLKTVVTQDYDNFEIIVSDNFSQDNTKEVVDSFNDPRIRYVNPGKRLSMSTHWEFALSHVSSGWVTLLGDDDGLMPKALSIVSATANKTGLQAITSIRNTYGWINSTLEANRLIVSLGEGYELRDGREWIKKWLVDDDAICSDLPSISTGGFADIEIINRARNKDGKFFLSITPDVYSAIAISSIVGKFVLLKEPIFVSGASHHSIGASGSCNAKSKILDDFYSENDIQFHDSLVGIEKIGSIPLGNYDCYLKSSFLHNDFLKIKLEDKLAHALSQISPIFYDKMIDYCKCVSNKNGIDFDIVVQKAEKIKNRIKIPKLIKIFNYLFYRRTIYDCVEFGARDIYGATILAKSIYLQETKYSHWRLSIIHKILKTILQYRNNLELLKKDFSIIHKST